jgi:hypothetical protein
MIWKRNLEEIAGKLVDMPPAPWRLHIDDYICVTDADGNELFFVENTIEQYHLLNTICMLRNNCELWFDEMKSAGISDIVLPKKKQSPKPKCVVPPTPELVTFNISEKL